MTCRESLEILFTGFSDDTVCCFTNGFIGRIAYLVQDRKTNFYMVGSMGLVASVGLGIALNSKKRVAVFDGDGSVLMNLGIMPLIGNTGCGNLLHIIMDNGCYASTGGQATVSGTTDFRDLAKAAGYPSVFSVRDAKDLKTRCATIMGSRGPVLLHLIVDAETATPSSRVNITPEDMANRIRTNLTTGV